MRMPPATSSGDGVAVCAAWTWLARQPPSTKQSAATLPTNHPVLPMAEEYPGRTRSRRASRRKMHGRSTPVPWTGLFIQQRGDYARAARVGDGGARDVRRALGLGADGRDGAL